METINKAMDRDDLLTEQAKPIVRRINDLINEIYSKKISMTSWYGTLGNPREAESAAGVGMKNRGADYKPLPDMADDGRIPWYLYWEIFWVMQHGPKIGKGSVVLDAGGTSSLFSCYVASLGAEVHSIDLNAGLVSNGETISKAMNWNTHPYCMDMKKLDFLDEFFDHAYSICVFEHLDSTVKKDSLEEIARCLKPNGILSITFDYRNPAPNIFGYGPDLREVNQLKTREDIRRAFLSSNRFELVGNPDFHDNEKSYLVHPRFDDAPYTFGAIFLKKK